MANKRIEYSVLEEMGYTTWAVSKQKSELGEEGSGFFFGSGFQTWSGKSLPRNEDNTDFTMYYVMFSDEVQQHLEDENGNKIYDVSWDEDTTEHKILAGASLFNTYYHGRLPDGSTVEYAGAYKNPEIWDIYDGDEFIGEFLANYEFDVETYQNYVESLPSKIPGMVSSKCYEMDNLIKTEVDAGISPQSVQAVAGILNVDGEPITEPPVMQYNEENRNALYRAMQNVTNGAKTARITFKDCLPVKMDRELVLQTFLNLEAWMRERECYARYWKMMVKEHTDDDKHTYKEFEKKYIAGETPLEEKYQKMYEAEMDEIMQELRDMQESWNIA